MARNAEKAMAVLSRWVRMKKQMDEIRLLRPVSPALCEDLGHAEKFRKDIIREIAKKITQIQNPGLGEFVLRDLNDEINSLLREKHEWELKIIELGGPDYTNLGSELVEEGQGAGRIGNSKYMYFGAARDLPGVKEAIEEFQKTETKPKFITNRDFKHCVDIDYFGYRDYDDPEILEMERICEETERKKAIENWKNYQNDEIVELIYPKKSKYKQFAQEIDFDEEAISRSEKLNFVPIGDIPSQSEMQRVLLDHKKSELINKYVSEEFLIDLKNEDHLPEL